MLAIQGQNIITSQNQPLKSHSKQPQKPPLPKKSTSFLKVEKTIKVLKHDYVSDERKQNILNARFIKKKQQLFDITRENVRLFQKINSQKSVYSHDSLHKTYESNKSLVNSRLTHRSNKSQLKKSQVSNSSKASQKSASNPKNKFFNRATSAKSNQNLPSSNKIVVKDIKRKSLVNLKPKNIQQTAKEDIQQFAGLFNIKEEPSKRQMNRPMRIKSTNTTRSLKTLPANNVSERKFSQSKQIVINEENDIEIHEEIEAEDWDTARFKSSRARSARMRQLSLNEKIPEVIVGSATVLEESKINLVPCQTEQCLKSSKQSSTQSCQNQTQNENLGSEKKFNRENIENLFEIKNSGIKSRLLQKIGNEKVSTKYANLITKINTELSKHVKKPKQTTIYPMRSRLIA